MTMLIKIRGWKARSKIFAVSSSFSAMMKSYMPNTQDVFIPHPWTQLKNKCIATNECGITPVLIFWGDEATTREFHFSLLVKTYIGKSVFLKITASDGFRFCNLEQLTLRGFREYKLPTLDKCAKLAMLRSVTLSLPGSIKVPIGKDLPQVLLWWIIYHIPKWINCAKKIGSLARNYLPYTFLLLKANNSAYKLWSVILKNIGVCKSKQ